MKQLSANKCFSGMQLRFQHPSAELKCDMTFSIYLPEESTHEKAPLLYWLSGLTCTDENFVTKAGAQRYAAEHGIAIVAPDTSPRGEDIPDDPEGAYDFGLGAGFYVDATRPPWAKNYRMYSYIVKELPALINSQFPVDSKRVGIFGHSMGGHGALTIGLKNPEMFKSISAFAPIVAPTQCPWGKKALRHYLGENIAAWKSYDACELIRGGAPKLPMLVDQGSVDNFLEEQLKTDLLASACRETNYPVDIRLQQGYDHSYFFIASFMADHIRFHAGHLI